MVSHSVAYLPGGFLWLHPNSRWWFYDGVPLFFVISGMLVYRSCERCIEIGRPVLQFYANRYLRVAPALYLYGVVTGVALLAFGLAPPSFLVSSAFAKWEVGIAALVPGLGQAGLTNVVKTSHLNGSLWTIPVEVSFYVVVPLFVVFERRYGFRRLATALGLVAALGVVALWHADRAPDARITRALNLTFLPYFGFFFLGILWLKLRHRVPIRGELAGACLAVYFVVRTLDVFGIRKALGPDLLVVAGALPLSYLVVFVGERAPAALARIPERVGDLSYGTYIWHMVVVNLLVATGAAASLAPRRWVNLPSLVIVSAVTLAMLSWWFVERPMLRRKPFSSRAVNDARAW